MALLVISTPDGGIPVTLERHGAREVVVGGVNATAVLPKMCPMGNLLFFETNLKRHSSSGPTGARLAFSMTETTSKRLLRALQARESTGSPDGACHETGVDVVLLYRVS